MFGALAKTYYAQVRKLDPQKCCKCFHHAMYCKKI